MIPEISRLPVDTLTQKKVIEIQDIGKICVL